MCQFNKNWKSLKHKAESALIVKFLMNYHHVFSTKENSYAYRFYTFSISYLMIWIIICKNECYSLKVFVLLFFFFFENWFL